MKTIPVFLLLVLVTGCCRSYQRFIPSSTDGGPILVDTKTGRLCDGSPDHRVAALPLCYDLYRGGK